MKSIHSLVAAKRLCLFRPFPVRMKALSQNFKSRQICKSRAYSTKMSEIDLTSRKRAWWKESVVYQVCHRYNSQFMTIFV
jgi:hypothetical protein